MPAKSPKAAAETFINFLKETLSCISTHYVNAYQQSSKLYKFYYEPYAPIQDDSANLYLLSVTQIFRTVKVDGENRFKAKTQEYSYRLLNGLNEDEEVLAYHWHPQEPGVQWPHLHIQECPRIHFPTSRVCLEDFVTLLIRDFKIRTHMPQKEWKEIIERNKSAFEKSATWKIQHP